jgi:hypothetical protein
MVTGYSFHPHRASSKCVQRSDGLFKSGVNRSLDALEWICKTGACDSCCKTRAGRADSSGRRTGHHRNNVGKNVAVHIQLCNPSKAASHAVYIDADSRSRQWPSAKLKGRRNIRSLQSFNLSTDGRTDRRSGVRSGRQVESLAGLTVRRTRGPISIAEYVHPFRSTNPITRKK